MRDQKENARLLLATDLKYGVETGFLTFEDIVRCVEGHLAHGLAVLVKLHGIPKIIGPLYSYWEGKKEDNLTLFEKALIGHEPLIEAMLKNIPSDVLLKILEQLVTSGVVTFDNLVAAFPPQKLSACVKESRQRAEEFLGEDEVEIIREGGS